MSKHKTTKKKSHRKEEEQEIKEGLEAIYGDGKIDFTKLEKGKSTLTTILTTVTITLSAVALVAWGSYFAYNAYIGQTETDPFDIQIIASEQVISGQNTQIQIQYKNPGNVPLAALVLDVKIPASFEPTTLSPTPDDTENLVWNLGSLQAGSQGTLAIEGTWLAQIPSSTPIQVVATYRPTNFNADFSEIETIYIETTQSTIETTVEGPNEILPGQPATYTITTTSNATDPINNVALDLTIPEGFYVESTTPQIEPGQQPEWIIESLETEPNVITVTGSFAADQTGFQYFNSQTSVVGRTGTKVTQHAAQTFTDVLSSDLNVGIAVNGSAQATSVELGKNINVTISLENSGNTEITAPELLLDFQSENALPINWSSATTDGGVIRAEGIRWLAGTIAPLEPGERTLLNLSFPVKDTVPEGNSDEFTLVLTTTAQSQELKTTPIDVTISSAASATSQARYFNQEGVPVGEGAIPPAVGKETTYQVEWSIQNTLHDLSDISMVATLPPNAVWKNTQTTNFGTLTYNEATKTVTWKISNLSAETTEINAQFDLSITPSANDVGTFVKLLSGAQFQATDTKTQTITQTTTQSLDTELPNDEFAQNKGIVIE